MKTKEEIVANWLPRYTKRNLEDFGEYILLTNFNKYVEIFAEKFNVPILGKDANMISASAEGITIINFGMGSPNAAIIMDLLSAIQPKACLFLGKCSVIVHEWILTEFCELNNKVGNRNIWVSERNIVCVIFRRQYFRNGISRIEKREVFK